MNYKKHYHLLMEKSKSRELNENEYKERHHIIPKCVGGNDDLSNLVDLTPEEHFVAHQLLVKMFPEEPKLIYAFNMMCCSSKFTLRNNKRYGWLKRKFQMECKKRTGSKNGSFGTMWITNGNENKKIKKGVDVIPEGWYKGRSNLFSLENRQSIGKSASARHTNTIYITNGDKTKRVDKHKKIPEGWYKGRSNHNMSDLMWITDGENNSRVKKVDPIPEGWYKGRTIK